MVKKKKITATEGRLKALEQGEHPFQIEKGKLLQNTKKTIGEKLNISIVSPEAQKLYSLMEGFSKNLGIVQNALSPVLERLNRDFFPILAKAALLGKKLEESENKAKEILNLIGNEEEATLQDFYELEPIDGFTLMYILEYGVNEKTQQKIKEAIKKAEVERTTSGAYALHSKPGGAWEKTAEIRKIWASGKYDSRTLCAEQECQALNWSYESARKALRNMPDPDPWAAKRLSKKK